MNCVIRRRYATRCVLRSGSVVLRVTTLVQFTRFFRASVLCIIAVLAFVPLATSASAQTVTFSCTGSKVTWVAPATGTYRVTATGARGAAANPAFQGGRGARVSGEFNFTAGASYQIAVGCVGTVSVPGINQGNGGGGGGSFFVDSGNNPLLRKYLEAKDEKELNDIYDSIIS